MGDDKEREPFHIQMPPGEVADLNITLSAELAEHFNKIGFDPSTAVLSIQALLNVVAAIARGDLRAQQFLLQHSLRFIDKAVADHIGCGPDIPPPGSDYWKS